MKRKGVWILAAVALLAALAGCDIFLAVPLVVDPINQTVSIVNLDGGAAVYWAVTGKGPLTVDYGDGTSSRLDLLAEEELTVSHLYHYIGTYTVRFTYGRTVTLAEVTVTCRMPQIDVEQFWNTSSKRIVDKGERLAFNMTWREYGCDNGTPQMYAGIQPGDGVTEFRVTATYSEGGRISLFDEAGASVWGEWIPLEVDVRKTQMVTAWAGWSGEETLIPMGCTPDPDPYVPPDIPPNSEVMTFTLTVRNQYMLPASYVIATWVIFVRPDSCN